MSEALLILQRAHAAYGSQLRMYERKLEKAEPGSDEERAAQHNIETVKVRMRDLAGAVAAFQEMGFLAPPPSDAL